MKIRVAQVVTRIFLFVKLCVFGILSSIRISNGTQK